MPFILDSERNNKCIGLTMKVFFYMSEDMFSRGKNALIIILIEVYCSKLDLVGRN